MRREDGGVLTRLLTWLVVIAVVASIGLYVAVRAQRPFAAGATIAQAIGAGPVDDVRLRPDGRIVVATTVVNSGRWPLTITGLADDRAHRDDPYVAVDLGLGDGGTATLDALAPITPTRLEPDQGLGIVVVFAPNEALRCRRLPVEIDGEMEHTELDSFGVAFEIAGIGGDQVVRTRDPFATIGPVTRAECEAVAGT